mgnify:CR=1 FL=1
MGFMARMWTAVQAKMNRIMGTVDTRDDLELSYEKQLLLLQDVKRSVAHFATYCERVELQREKLQLSMEKLEAQAKGPCGMVEKIWQERLWRTGLCFRPRQRHWISR